MFSLFAATIPMMVLSGGLTWIFYRGARTLDWQTLVSKVALCFFLSMGLGAGVSSILFFLGLVFLIGPETYPLGETYLVLAVGALLATGVFWNRNNDSTAGEPISTPLRAWPTAPLLIVFALVALWAVLHFLQNSQAIPHGSWDSWAIWNLRAKFLSAGGPDWAVAFDPAFIWPHTDYPLLVPATIARFWRYLGEDSCQVPRFLGMSFTFGTIGVIVSALSLTRSMSQGLLAGLILLSSFFFLDWGGSQYADVPLSYFIVSSLASVVVYDRWGGKPNRLLVFAGLLAGFAAWTKNEGLLFVLCFGVSRTLVATMIYGWRPMLRQQLILGLGLLPVLVLVYAFKASVAVPNDLVAESSLQGILNKLCDGSRYLLIIQSLTASLREIPVTLVVSLAVFIVFVGANLRRDVLKFSAFPNLCLALMSIGYFFVYVLTPKELKWHLDTSFSRLLLQLLPTAIYTMFLTMGTIEEASTGAKQNGAA